MQDLTVTIVQSALAWEQPQDNLRAFEATIGKLNAPGDVIVLPEMFTTGFSMNAPALAEPPDGPAVQWMADMAVRTNAAVCGSLIVRDGGRYYNRCVWMPPDGALRTYDKRHLFRMAGEHQHYSAGGDRLLVNFRGWNICPLVCYDLRFPVFARHIGTCDLMLFVANWPAPRAHAWRTLLTARAIENVCYVAGVNRTGEDGKGIPYPGQSGIIDYVGEWLADPGEQPAVHTHSLSSASLLKFRDRFPFHLDADAFELQPPPPGE